MERRGYRFFSNYYRALKPDLAASRRTASRPEGSLKSVYRAVVIFEGLQLGFIVLIGLINNLDCDGLVKIYDILF